MRTSKLLTHNRFFYSANFDPIDLFFLQFIFRILGTLTSRDCMNIQC
jgi:hypothetical protein